MCKLWIKLAYRLILSRFPLGSNLDETTRSVYKENVRLNEALNYHVKEADELKAEKEKLVKENSQLKGDRELQDQLIQEKVVGNKKQKKQINDVSSNYDNITVLVWCKTVVSWSLQAFRQKKIKTLLQYQSNNLSMENLKVYMVNWSIISHLNLRIK